MEEEQEEEEQEVRMDAVMISTLAGGSIGVVSSIILAMKSKRRANILLPHVIIGFAAGGGTYSVRSIHATTATKQIAESKKTYSSAKIGAISGALSGLAAALIIGPAPVISLSLASFGAVGGAVLEQVHNSALTWRKRKILEQHGIIETAHPTNDNADVDNNDQKEAKRDLPLWLPLRSQESLQEMAQKHARMVMLKQEIRDLEAAIAMQEKNIEMIRSAQKPNQSLNSKDS
eukprot:gene10879-2954_t